MCGAVAIATAASAQQRTGPERWRFGRITTPVAGGQWGVGVQAGVGYEKDVHPGPSAVTGALRMTGTYGITTGSTEASIVFEAPALWRDWKVLGLLRSERMQRTPFFGLANETPRVDSLQDAFGTRYYRYSLLRTGISGALHRRIAGPLWMHAGGQVRHYRASPLKQRPSLFETATAGPLPDTVRRDGAELRGGLIVDTRDDWHATTKGLLLETIVASGRLSAPTGETGMSYRRYVFGATEFMRLGASGRTVLALRQRVSVASDSLPFFLAYEQPTTWLPNDGIVGARAVRLHGGGTQLSSSHGMATIEVRRKLVIPSDNPLRAAGLWGMLFVDGALLWEPRVKPTFERNEWTVGAGFRLQFSQGHILGVDAGVTDAGLGLSISSAFGF